MTKIVVGAAVVAVCSALIFMGALPAAASDPTIAVNRTSGLLDGQLVSVTGSGFTPGAPAGVVECSNAPGQPSVEVEGFAVAVSCDSPINGSEYPFVDPELSTVAADGTLSTYFVVHTGIVGPPTLGIDSAGHNAAADAALYPCPPTPAQQAAGVGCELTLGDFEGISASVSINFASPSPASPSVTVSPSGGLSNGDQVTVSGAGFIPDSPWLAIECNFTPKEPAGAYGTPNLPISCDQATASPSTGSDLAQAFPTSSVTDSSGAMSTTLTIAEGNIGGSQQSQPYPCPPSAANVAAGGSCAVLVEDGAGQQATFTIGITGPVPSPTISVSPSAGLVGGATVQVSGEDFAPNQLAGVLECNAASGQPTVLYDGIQIPVSCSNPQIVDTSSIGSLTTGFAIVQGVTGPPATGTDSAGGSAGSDAAEYPCPPTPAQQAEGVTCDITVGDLEGDVAQTQISFTTLSRLAAPVVGIASTPDGNGYWLVASDGGVFTFGDAGFYGSMGAKPLNKPVVGMAATPDGKGYWLVASDGGVFTFGDAGFYGSMGAKPLNKPVVGMAATPDGKGYWLVASDGGVFTFGDAGFYGSMGAKPLNKPVVGIASTPDGNGYWLVASDGGVFTFGDAGFYGSMGAKPLNKPVVGIASTPDGNGYWLVASDGGVFTFGDAGFYGSTGGKPLNKPVVGIASTPDGNGYWLGEAGGGALNFGQALFEGSFPTS